MDITNLLIYAEEHNINVDYFKMKNDGIALKNNNDFIVVLKKAFEHDYSFKHKELLAHELAHCILDSFYMVDPSNPMSRYNFGRYEQEAKEFCIKWILPFKKLKRALKENLCADGSLWSTQEYLGVSMDFLLDAIEYYRIRGEKLPQIKNFN